MKARLLNLWDSLRTSYWFIPAIMTGVAGAASFGAVELDRYFLRTNPQFLSDLYETGDAEGARALLSTVAGSMITVAGVTFSILLVALSLASSQFGPRLLRGFLRDTGNQVVLGTFIATFVYCLLVLRSVPLVPGGAAIPHVSVSIALVLGLAGVCVLIYFIHHAASSIRASEVIEVAGRELDRAIRHTFPEPEEDAGSSRAAGAGGVDLERVFPDGFEDGALPIESHASGYVQEIDTHGLVDAAREHEVLIELLHGRGGFVAEHRTVARVFPSDGADDGLRKVVTDALVLGVARVSTRDVEQGMSQLAEVAVRALSPGVNDPFTAINAIDRLGLSFTLLAERDLPASTFEDEEGTVRLVVPVPRVAELLHLAFDQVRHYGHADPHVPLRLVETLGAVGARARHPEFLLELRKHVDMIRRASLAAFEEEEDRRRLEGAYDEAVAILDGRSEESRSRSHASHGAGRGNPAPSS